MKKLFKFLLTVVLVLVFFSSLSLGVLRKLEVLVETEITYTEYVSEGKDYHFKSEDSKYYLVTTEGEIECQLDNNSISVLLGETLIEAMISDDFSTIEVVNTLEPENNSVFNGETKTYKIKEPIKPSDYVYNFLGLKYLEDLIDEYYFNSLFCSISGGLLALFTSRMYRLFKKRNKNRSIKAKGKKDIRSLKTVTPSPVRIKIDKN